MSALSDAVAALARGESMTAPAAQAAFDSMLACDPESPRDAALLGGFLMGLAVRGATATDLVAGARALRARVAPVAAPPALADALVDTCGTGGDAASTVNISTAAALIAAGAGAAVAKHGGRAVSSRSGSADVLRALGVAVDASAESATQALDQAGVAFLFAPAHHAAMARVAGVRRALGVRTVFNLLGPLTNPAGARRQVLGVYAADMVAPMAQALRELGAVRAWVVHGRDGLDELTTTGPSLVASVTDNGVETFEVTPEDAGLPRARLEDLRGGDVGENAAALRAVLNGSDDAALRSYRDIAVLNAAAALVVADRAGDLRDGARQAAAAIDSGAAARALERLVTVTAAAAGRAAHSTAQARP